MIETICQECGRPLSFPNQYVGMAKACHFCGAIVSLPDSLPIAARAQKGTAKGAHNSVRLKRPVGPFGIDRGLLIFTAVWLAFSVLLAMTGFLTGQTGSPFSLTLFVLGFVVLVASVVGVCAAIIDVDVLSDWTRATFTLWFALLLFGVTGGLGIWTAMLTYSP